GLVDARAHDHGGGVARHEVLAGHVIEPAGGIVHGSGEHTGEGQSDIVLRSFARAPLVILRAHDTFTGQHIGVGALHAVGLKRAVEVEHEFVCGGLPGGHAVPVDHPLVGTV